MNVSVIKIQTNSLTCEQFIELYQAARWDAPMLFQVEAALTHSFAMFSAYDSDKLIGKVCLISDCGMSFLVKDFIVREEYRGKVVGRCLLEAAETEIRKTLQPDWKVSVELMSL